VPLRTLDRCVRVGSVARSTHLGRTGTALFAGIAACLTLLAGASVASARLAESLTHGKAHFVLDRTLIETLTEKGVRVAGSGPARVQGRTVTMPLREAFLEYGGGSGYALERGGLRFRGPHGSVALGGLVLNTAKDRFNATIAGRNTVLATPEGVDGTPTRYGLEVAVKRLQLTGAGARALNRALGLRRVFVAGDTFARVRVSGETPTVPIGLTSFQLGFDEGFRQKLEALGVAVTPGGSAAQLSATPLVFSFPDSRGDANRGLTHGGIRSRSYVRLSEGAFPDLREARIEVGVSFESALAGRVWETSPASHSSGPNLEADFSGTTLDPATGTLEGPSTPIALSPSAAAELNEALSRDGVPQFQAGDPLGTLVFSGRLGR
jgi:hypothetical protein